MCRPNCGSTAFFLRMQQFCCNCTNARWRHAQPLRERGCSPSELVTALSSVDGASTSDTALGPSIAQVPFDASPLVGHLDG